MSADRAAARRRALSVLPFVVLGACSWFTDFKDQPRYEPWETENDTTPMRANPQLSVPMHGIPLPGLVVSYRPLPNVIDSIGTLVTNPIAADARSLENGRKSYQINCAVCHGANGQGAGPATQYGVPGIGLVSPRVAAYSDGYIYGMMRNGRGLMPSYNRINETERWDVVNYIRGLQGRFQVATAPAGYPGETGATLPSATEEAPTRPAPYFNRAGSQAGIRLGASGATAPVAPAAGAAADSVGADSTVTAGPGAPGQLAPSTPDARRQAPAGGAPPATTTPSNTAPAGARP